MGKSNRDEEEDVKRDGRKSERGREIETEGRSIG